jgi:hypothetical protein
MERMLAGVATRRHARTGEPVGAQVDREAKSTSRSAISRRFVRQTETALAELAARDLSGEDIKVLTQPPKPTYNRPNKQPQPHTNKSKPSESACAAAQLMLH